MPRFADVGVVLGLAVLALPGCSRPSLPLDIRRCDAIAENRSIELDITARSRAEKPISSVTLEVDFSGPKVEANAGFVPPLQNGQTRDATVKIASTIGILRPPMRCTATRIVYADGTTQGDRTTP